MSSRRYWYALVSIVAAALMTSYARANAIYVYTGQPFNDFRNGGSCPPTCRITGSFTVPVPLAPNLPSLTEITPLSFTISSGNVTLTNGEPTDTSLAVGTDASGAITTWSWVVVGPASSPTARLLTQKTTPEFTFDDVRIGNSPPPNVGPVIALVQGAPGTWSTTAVPEPGTICQIAGGLLIIGLVRLSKRRVHNNEIRN